MKLLILTSNTNRSSFRQRIEVYLDSMRNCGIIPTVALLPKNFLSRRKLLKKASQFNGVLIHKKGLNFFDAGILRKSAGKIIYNFDDAVMLSDKKPSRYSGSHFRPWRRSVTVADMVIVGSSHLADLALQFNKNVHVLPIGLNLSDYPVGSHSLNDGKIRLVWIGSKSTLDYLVELKPVLEKIGQSFDNVILRIIGDDFFDLNRLPVEKCSWSLQTSSRDLSQCDIGLAPLPDNPFTRGKCSFKVLEYSSCRLPVVASPVGTNSDYIKNGQTGFLANSPDEWFDKLSLLIKDSALRKTMGAEGRTFAKSFDLSLIGKQFTELIIDCLRG